MIVVGLVSSEGSTQERIHQAWPWTATDCQAWSLAWLLGGLGIALISWFIAQYLARPAGPGATIARRIVWWVSLASVAYWIANFVGAHFTTCIS
jgi:hypothetical protein